METVNRILQEKITARIAPNKAVLIFGARRVGKTVMMRKIVDNYSGRTMMLNGEDYDTLALLENRSIANYRHLLDGIDLLAIGKKCCKANRQPTSFFCFCRRHGKVTSYLSGCCQCIKPYL